MADMIDVCNTLVAQISAALYPLGTAQPSPAGVDSIVYAGWPVPATLNADLVAGKVHVSVFPLHQEHNTTRYPDDWMTVRQAAPTLTLDVSGQSVAVGGAVGSAPQTVGLVIGGSVYGYSVQPGDTLESIASALAAVVAADYADVSASGATLLLPPGAVLHAARVATTGLSLRELRRQEKRFQVNVWAATPDAREAVSLLIDPALARPRFLTLPDGTAARLIWHHGRLHDEVERARVYRREFIYRIEYATTETAVDTAIAWTQLRLGTQGTLVGPPVPVLTTDDGSILVIADGHALVLE